MEFIKEWTHWNEAILHEALYNNNSNNNKSNTNYKTYATVKRVSIM